MIFQDKERLFQYEGRNLRLLNQSCPAWTHPYPYPDPNNKEKANLHTSGCGIFSVAHLVDWFKGEKIDVHALADFACANGARVDDGTDRPILLAALENAGQFAKWGLHYKMDGALNDTALLGAALKAGNVALSNLRNGHIVALVAPRIKDHEEQVLVIDSAYDSMHPAVRSEVREVIAGSEVHAKHINRLGVYTGEDIHYQLFWVPLSLPSDFNILWKSDK